MKLFLPFLMILGGCFGTNEIKSKPFEKNKNNMSSNKSFYDFKMKSINGDIIDFSKYKGKKVLIVNTASECGYTKQYKDLEQLNKLHGDKVVIIGFPSNNFGGQEPGSNEEIASFCQKNYGVSFQMYEKVDVTGKNACDLYKWLSDKSLNGWNDQSPKWNFNKYLIDENGQLVKYFASNINPMSEEIISSLK
ncbi:MAG: glutathione peroxidase [bacterium]|jgi:glutathione peroxidase